MRYFEHVLVSLAMAPVDRDLLRYARLIREMGEGRTHCSFVHVLPPADLVAQGSGPVLSLSDARAALSETVVEEIGPSAAHDVKVIAGHLVDALLTEAAEEGTDLIMVGHRRDAKGRRTFSRRLAIKAPCSVWMVPEGSAPRITGVLAAVDMSLPSAQALSLATLVASRAKAAKCTVLHVQSPSELGLDGVERDSAEKALERFLSPLDLHGVTVTTRIEESGSVSGPTNAIVDELGLDLVVVGTRGRSPSAATLLGSESEHVLVESKVPVLITKEPGARIGLVRALLDRDFQPRYRTRFG
ncbi:MAG: universal stress protein [Acidimicrobiia bacterium]|nr:universal stress protein [Acidimicrobiia bacterium]